MMIWFTMLAVVGIYHIFDDPSIFKALNPYYAIDFVSNYPGGSGCSVQFSYVQRVRKHCIPTLDIAVAGISGCHGDTLRHACFSIISDRVRHF